MKADSGGRAVITDYESAWASEVPAGDVWTPRPWVAPAVRGEQGRRERKRVPRRSHAAFEPRGDRDPIAILESQEADRLTDLLPLRHARMAESPFAYYRGTPAVMAFDLAGTPSTDIVVQASGDAHLSNFGLFASPERQLVFDANDFDETLPAPWEWDVKRLASSIVVAGRGNRFTAAENRVATMATVRCLPRAGWRPMPACASSTCGTRASPRRTSVSRWRRSIARRADAGAKRAKVEAVFSKARGRDVLKAAASLTSIVDGRLLIATAPPALQRVEVPGGPAALARVFDAYRATMPESLREFLQRYRFADFALKVVGVGSVGTRCFIVVLEGRDERDPLILQAKEATASVLQPYVAPSTHQNHGERVVHGQRIMQATPDIFLGWSSSVAGRDFYFRQLWDMKGSVDITTLEPIGLAFYGGLCAHALASAHARSGDAVAISAYLGSSDSFDGAVADFSEAYADQNERDHAAYRAAIAEGRVTIPAD